MTSEPVSPFRVDETPESTRLDDPRTSQATGDPERGPHVSRRAVIKAGAGVVLAAAAGAPAASDALAQAPPALGFDGVPSSTADRLIVAPGHVADVVLRWGDPILPGAAPFDPAHLMPAAQAGQFGYNCDYVAFLPLDDDPTRALLFVNHESVSPELMFPDFDPAQPTADQIGVEMNAHGASIVEIRRDAAGRWQPVPDSPRNRRITADTPIEITGPAAGHAWMRTVADPGGRHMLGTLNNCGGGRTPWGTVLTSEENFHKYFANYDKLPDADPRKANLKRYGFRASSDYGWERYHARYDVQQEPNEAFRYGWIVEVDPYDPSSMPKKRTALGRFRHEAADIVVSPAGRAVVYSGDDATFEYVYKFVSAGGYSPTDQAGNLGLLDEGTLYAARFNADGSGDWLPLVHGRGPLTGANGFASQADVVLATRRAADLVGATPMDRPEDVEVNPTTGRVAIALTKNSARGTAGKPGVDAANPRAKNTTGHIIELTEDRGDHAAERFRWQIFMLCGDPADASTDFGGQDKATVDAIACPDNLAHDIDGNLWIATDGQPDAIGIHDALYAVPVAGAERGAVRRFLSAVPGAEVTGPEFTPDNTALFVAIQHPGEGGTYAAPASRWPDYAGPPRPSVVAVRSLIPGGRVGQVGGGQTAARSVQQPLKLPATGSAAWPGANIAATVGIGLAALGLMLTRRRAAVADSDDERE